MTKQLLVVIRTRGPSWQSTRPIEGQADWAGHATFMDALANEGFVLLAGPLEETSQALLVVRAGSSSEVHARLAADPWTINGLLQTTLVTPWTLRLGSLG